MNTPDIWLRIAVCGTAIAAAALAMAIGAYRSLGRYRAHCASLESHLAALSREFEMLASISARTGRCVRRTEQAYSGLEDRVERIESRAAPVSFEHAIDSARRGATPDKLAQQFGLSRNEAELVARLHGREKRAQQPAR